MKRIFKLSNSTVNDLIGTNLLQYNILKVYAFKLFEYSYSYIDNFCRLLETTLFFRAIKTISFKLLYLSNTTNIEHSQYHYLITEE